MHASNYVPKIQEPPNSKTIAIIFHVNYCLLISLSSILGQLIEII